MRLEYCSICKDRPLRGKFISGIINTRLASKLMDKGHRDKATREMTPFKTTLQMVKNFEQCEKAKAVMQQIGLIEHVNYTGVRKPLKSEQNWGKGLSSHNKSEKGRGRS